LTLSAKAHKLLAGLTPKKGSLVELKIMFEKWKQEERRKYKSKVTEHPIPSPPEFRYNLQDA
jgi:hypothetical protein